MINAPHSTHHFITQLETESFARKLSLWAKPGLVIALSGDLGSGKSTFARAFIQALAKSTEPFDIPSPTFPIVQTYDNTRIPVAHVDLYRLSKPEEIADLGIIELWNENVVLIEWPELIQASLPPSTLFLKFNGHGHERYVELSANGFWQNALARDRLIEDFISNSDWQRATRKFFEGDASARRYESLHLNSRHCLLMDMPQRPDGPPVKDGKPYSAIAHLAEGITAVAGVNKHLTSLGYSAPNIEKVDLENGLAIIENLGGQVFGDMMRSGQDMRGPMTTAVELLADMANKTWPSSVELENQKPHIVPPYDIDALMIEVDLLPSWFWPYIHGTNPPEKLHHSFDAIWRELLPKTQTMNPQWVLRDYHSPNLIWLAERSGIQRIGLIDTQDAVMGHAAYDLASMLQDARIDIDFNFADELYGHYVGIRMKQDKFNQQEFETAYAILGAQRATKILGIFARLAKRDQKPGYLKHMPRVSRYLARNLKHPELGHLAKWYEEHLPQALDIGKL